MKGADRAGRLDRWIERFSRITSGGRLIPEIDGLRFFAIGGVVLYHLNGYLLARAPVPFDPSPDVRPLNLLVRHGNYGVQLFFALSGFILMLPFAERILANRPRPSLRDYFTRRLTRLEPPYVANVLIAFSLLVVARGESFADVLPHLGASLLYIHNAVFGESSVINPVAWSLEVEVQFYVVAPLLATLFRVRGRLRRRAIVVLAIAAFGSLKQIFPEKGLFLSLPGQMPYFLVGILLADLYLVDWESRPARGPGGDLLAALALAAMLPVAHFGFHVDRALPPLILLFCVGAFRGRVWNGVVRNRWLVVVGGMCYTIYLYHAFAISLLGRVTVGLVPTKSYELALLVQLVLVAVPTIAACALLFAALERPFMRRDWPSRFASAVRLALRIGARGADGPRA